MHSDDSELDGYWLSVCSVAEFASGGVRTAASPGLSVAVFRLADLRLFAIEDRCPHRGARLSCGVVYDGDKIACLDHGWGIRLADGGVEPPEHGRVLTFPVKVEDGQIQVFIAAVAPPLKQRSPRGQS
jgi:nitrite reductase (NADH) small subunit